MEIDIIPKDISTSSSSSSSYISSNHINNNNNNNTSTTTITHNRIGTTGSINNNNNNHNIRNNSDNNSVIENIFNESTLLSSSYNSTIITENSNSSGINNNNNNNNNNNSSRDITSTSPFRGNDILVALNNNSNNTFIINNNNNNNKRESSLNKYHNLKGYHNQKGNVEEEELDIKEIMDKHQDSGIIIDGHQSSLYSPAPIDDTTPLNPKNFSKIYEANLSKHAHKKFVYLFPIWLEEKLRAFDDPIIKICQTYTNKYTYYLSLFITSIVAIEIAIASPVFLFIIGQDALATEFTYLALLLSLLSQLPKRFLWRFRPYMVQRAKTMKKDQTSSFPSRAVTCSVVYSYAIIWMSSYYNRDSPAFQWWMPFLFIIMIGLSSFARINLGVHYPSDCVGGVIQGTLVCLIGTALKKADIAGCRSCWDGACYAYSSASEISFGTLSRLNFVMLSILLILCIVIPVVSVMKPVDFWSKCDRVYGMLFPSICFQLVFLCPQSYEQNGSLPPPPIPQWYTYIFGIGLSGLATVVALKSKGKYSILTFWILFLSISVALFSWRLARVY